MRFAIRRKSVLWIAATAMALAAIWFVSIQVFYYCDRLQVEYEQQHAAEGK